MPRALASIRDDLSYTVPVQTANGTTYAAPVRLRSIAIGPLVIHNVEALVAQAPAALRRTCSV